MMPADAPSGKYWMIEVTSTSAIEEKENPSVIKCRFKCGRNGRFFTHFLYSSSCNFFLRRIIISPELNWVNHFLFFIDCGKVARRCRGFVFTKFQGKEWNKIPMTVRGAELLRQELDFLKNERRPEIIKAIAEAREHGDLKGKCRISRCAWTTRFLRRAYSRNWKAKLANLSGYRCH